MIAKRGERSRLPSKSVLVAIAEALKEITSYFELEGFSAHDKDLAAEEVLGEKSEPDVEPDGYYNDEGDLGWPRVFDREDVEVAIGVFVSELVRNGLLAKSTSDDAMSFSEVFETFFDGDHEIVQKARDFEEQIEGYFDLVQYDDMHIASKQALEIQNMLLKLLSA